MIHRWWCARQARYWQRKANDERDFLGMYRSVAELFKATGKDVPISVYDSIARTDWDRSCYQARADAWKARA